MFSGIVFLGIFSLLLLIIGLVIIWSVCSCSIGPLFVPVRKAPFLWLSAINSAYCECTVVCFTTPYYWCSSAFLVVVVVDMILMIIIIIFPQQLETFPTNADFNDKHWPIPAKMKGHANYRSGTPIDLTSCCCYCFCWQTERCVVSCRLAVAWLGDPEAAEAAISGGGAATREEDAFYLENDAEVTEDNELLRVSLLLFCRCCCFVAECDCHYCCYDIAAMMIMTTSLLILLLLRRFGWSFSLPMSSSCIVWQIRLLLLLLFMIDDWWLGRWQEASVVSYFE